MLSSTDGHEPSRKRLLARFRGSGGSPFPSRQAVAGAPTGPAPWSAEQTSLLSDLSLGTKADSKRWMANFLRFEVTLLPSQEVPANVRKAFHPTLAKLVAEAALGIRSIGFANYLIQIPSGCTQIEGGSE